MKKKNRRAVNGLCSLRSKLALERSEGTPRRIGIQRPSAYGFLPPIFASLGRKEAIRSYTKPGILRPVVIPTYDEVPVGIIRKNLQTAGISRDEYFLLLKST